MKKIALIPARAGSKGVPHKNKRKLGGKLLIDFTIDLAKQSKLFDTIFLTTDDEDIYELGKRSNIYVPELRPKKLSTDTTAMMDVVQYAIEHLKKIENEDFIICLLQPTVPFRSLDLLINSIQKFQKESCDSLISVREVPTKFNPAWTFLMKDDLLFLSTGEKEPISRRQDLPKSYYRDGSLYLFSSQTVSSFGNIYGEKINYFLNMDVDINIDYEDDFKKAEEFISSAV